MATTSPSDAAGNPNPLPVAQKLRLTLSNIFHPVVLVIVTINAALTAYLVTQLTFFAPRSSPIPLTNSTDANVLLLQAQLEATQRYHGDVLSTLWGTLAAIATVVVVVTVLGSIQNTRLYERDKLALQDQAQRQLEARTEQLTHQIDIRVNELLEVNKAQIVEVSEQLRHENSESLERIVDQLTATMDKRFTSATTEIARLTYAIQSDIAEEALDNAKFDRAITFIALSLKTATRITRTRPKSGGQYERDVLRLLSTLLESAVFVQYRAFANELIALLEKVSTPNQPFASTLITLIRETPELDSPSPPT